MLLEKKDFFNLRDVCEYLILKGCDYKIQQSYNPCNFHDDLYNLFFEKKISILIEVESVFNEDSYKIEYINENESKHYGRITRYQNELNHNFFNIESCLVSKLFERVLHYGSKSSFLIFSEKNGESDIKNTAKRKDSVEIDISLSKLRIPKDDLIKLYDENESHTSITQAYIRELETEISQLKSSHINELTEHKETNYLKTIGLLLELLTSPKGIDSKPPFQSEAIIISQITDQNIYGQRKSTLEKRFSEAKKALVQARKA